MPNANAMAVDLCPEVEILLCSARTHMDSATAERLKALLGGTIDGV